MTTQSAPGIDWKNIKAVIFDVDGTLYDQRRLRFKMLCLMAQHFCSNRQALHEIRIIRHFRKVREHLSEKEASGVSRDQLGLVAEKLFLDPQSVAAVVEKWIYIKPLDYILAYRFPMVDIFFDALVSRGIKIGIFSDYPLEDKLEKLELRADAFCYSLEPDIDRLKPQTAGLKKLVSIMCLDASECLFIGDRESRDGACAQRFGMPFLLCRGRDFYKKLLQDPAWTGSYHETRKDQ